MHARMSNISKRWIAIVDVIYTHWIINSQVICLPLKNICMDATRLQEILSHTNLMSSTQASVH